DNFGNSGIHISNTHKTNFHKKFLLKTVESIFSCYHVSSIEENAKEKNRVRKVKRVGTRSD
ncbi:hypothetical protein, partial [Enterococcus faecalis]|uniref:hypothetical protein n=1 Tax=Enterococcus faecalis TaxID=1351 RepID=UPI003D6B0DEB